MAGVQPSADPSSGPTATSSSPAKPEADSTFYNWSTFFSILTETASPATREAYMNHRALINEDADIARCNEYKKFLLSYSPIIRFLTHQINLLGPADGSASINASNIRVQPCSTKQSGGFDPNYGILICSNHIRNQGHFEDSLAHEMVHAYDHLRFKMDPLDLRHAACMEIRASTLSGECRFMREFVTRRQWGSVTQQLQECVRRRAAISVAARPACRDDVQAVQVVNEVWDSCFNDTRPFDEIYR